jgi:hypothetical protein
LERPSYQRVQCPVFVRRLATRPKGPQQRSTKEM